MPRWLSDVNLNAMKTIKENINSKELKKLMIRLLVKFKAVMYIMFVEYMVMHQI